MRHRICDNASVKLEPLALITRPDVNGGVELRLLAADGYPEHRLRLSEAEARELLRLLRNLLEPAG
jgi:hypothetical protein